jgi:hypothetical protein
VRIGSFDQRRYPDACEAAWPQTPCDADCRHRVEWVEAPRRLLDALAARLEDLPADVVVVDVTGNDGGRSWADPAARLLTAEPLECPRQSVVVHPVWQRRATDAVAALDSAGWAAGTPDDRDRLAFAAGRLRSWHAELHAPGCDRSPLWQRRDPGCTRLTTTAMTACGPLSYAPPGSLAGIAARDLVFAPLGLEFREGAWTGPVVVIADGGTASAAERFVAILQDHGVAVVVGEATAGSGCGYAAGAVPVTLTHSNLLVAVPDCVRWRRDGTNEVDGVVPDRPVPWSSLGRAGRSAAVVDAVARIR